MSHVFTIWLAKQRLTPVDRVVDDAILQTTFLGKKFSKFVLVCKKIAQGMRAETLLLRYCADNPLGLAAGCDKHGEAVSATDTEQTDL